MTWEQVVASIARKARETERRRSAKPSLGRMPAPEQVGRKA